jgi:CubicO group peptidase (beta-lactamase class C family)
MTALSQLADWPVGRAAAAVVGPGGVLETWGDLAQPFGLASVTKPLSALAAMVAIEEEAIALQDLLPGTLGGELPGATVAHLLAHASGIAADTPTRVAAAGTRRIYSNCGFEMLAELIAEATGIGFGRYLAEAVFAPLGMTGAGLAGSPAKDGTAGVADLVPVLSEFLQPSLLDPSTVALMTTVQFPGLAGVLPGYGRQAANDWGLGLEIRGEKSPHWTGASNSPATFGHFGQSGTMLWVDPVAQLGLVALADRDFGDWAIAAWPALSDAVLRTYA